MVTGADKSGSWVSLLGGGYLADTWGTAGYLEDTYITFEPNSILGPQGYDSDLGTVHRLEGGLLLRLLYRYSFLPRLLIFLRFWGIALDVP